MSQLPAKSSTTSSIMMFPKASSWESEKTRTASFDVLDNATQRAGMHAHQPSSTSNDIMFIFSSITDRSLGLGLRREKHW
jgi:hypothetical protein